MSTRVIVNAMAGKENDLSRTLATIREGLPGEVEARLVHGPGDAAELAREAVEAGVELVVSAGGDGTLHGVVNGFRAADDPPVLGVLPLGTGNDFSRSIGMPLDLEEALEALSAGAQARIDLVRMEMEGEGEGEGDRVLINASAAGFSGRVDEGMTPEFKKSWGPLAYLRSAVDTISETEDYETRITCDDGDALELRVFNVVVANGRTVGGGVPIAPEARADDGLLDVVVIASSEVGELVRLAPRIAMGRHLDHELVTVRRCSAVEVSSEPPMRFNADGELLGRGTARYRVLPDALSVIVGPGERAVGGD